MVQHILQIFLDFRQKGKKKYIIKSKVLIITGQC